MIAMFQYCQDLTGVDLSHWNIWNLGETTSMFEGSANLERIYATYDTDDRENWDISNADAMFNWCESLV